MYKRQVLDSVEDMNIKDICICNNGKLEEYNVCLLYTSGKRLWKEGTEGIRYIDNNGKIIDNLSLIHI